MIIALPFFACTTILFSLGFPRNQYILMFKLCSVHMYREAKLSNRRWYIFQIFFLLEILLVLLQVRGHVAALALVPRPHVHQPPGPGPQQPRHLQQRGEPPGAGGEVVEHGDTDEAAAHAVTQRHGQQVAADTLVTSRGRDLQQVEAVVSPDLPAASTTVLEAEILSVPTTEVQQQFMFWQALKMNQQIFNQLSNFPRPVTPV